MSIRRLFLRPRCWRQIIALFRTPRESGPRAAASPGTRRRRGGRIAGTLAAVLLALSGTYALLSYYAPALLIDRVPMAKADWIVMLGGERVYRTRLAAELFHQGVAPRVFIAGGPECLVLAERLEAAGVPASALKYECGSSSTYENALYVRDALAQSAPRKILIVTSWFHSSRAVRIFAKVWPEVDWGVDGADSNENVFGFLKSTRVTIEYLKYAWYKLRYQI